MTETTPLTPEQLARKAEFDRLFESIPGRNIDRVRLVAEILCYKPNTVRNMRMKKRTLRVIPTRMLDVLRRELARRMQ